jgi:hypothetical protein
MGGGSTMDDLKSKAGRICRPGHRQGPRVCRRRQGQGRRRAAQRRRRRARRGRQARGNQAAPVADYARRAAEGIDRFSETLQTKSLDELLSDVRRLVRGNPAVAVGAAAVVGFAIARFLKATPQNEYQTDYSAGYDDDYRA